MQLGGGLVVCLLGQNISEKVLPGVRSKVLKEILKHHPRCILEWKPIHLGKMERKGFYSKAGQTFPLQRGKTPHGSSHAAGANSTARLSFPTAPCSSGGGACLSLDPRALPGENRALLRQSSSTQSPLQGLGKLPLLQAIEIQE